MKARAKRGFTLIELVVALAIFVVIITGVSAALGSFVRLKSTYDQQMIVQQNFGVAVARISQDMRAAVEYTPDPSFPAVKKIVKDPADNCMGETLTIYVYDPTTLSSSQQVTYQVQGSAPAGYAVYRDVYDGTSLASHQAITENMHQLVKLYFATDGKKVVVMMVGETTYGGKLNKISFTSLIYTRNTGYLLSPS